MNLRILKLILNAAKDVVYCIYPLNGISFIKITLKLDFLMDRGTQQKFYFVTSMSKVLFHSTPRKKNYFRPYRFAS